jgi:hypothetical protein
MGCHRQIRSGEPGRCHPLHPNASLWQFSELGDPVPEVRTAAIAGPISIRTIGHVAG